MSKKPPQEMASENAAFDTKPLDQFWEMWVKGKRQEFVYVWAHVWVDARTAALCYFRDANGFSVGYDAVEGVALDEGKVTIESGSILLRKEQAGGATAFEATGSIDCGRARRGHGLRKRQSVAQQRGRESAALSGGVQANGSSVVRPDEGDAAHTPPRLAAGGKEPDGPSGVRERQVGDPAVGAASGPPDEGG